MGPTLFNSFLMFSLKNLLGPFHDIMICKVIHMCKVTILTLSFMNIHAKLHPLCNSYTMGCPPACGDNPQALASGLSYVQVGNPWYIYFIPPTSV